MTLPLPGFRHLPSRLDPMQQQAIVDEVLEAANTGAWFEPTMPRSGRPLSVEMANLGSLGWVSDKAGYRYTDRHPVSGRPWPCIPLQLLQLWDEVTGYPGRPECCLVNLYRGGAKMGLHQDRDEEALDAPVLSISLGDTGIFRIGGVTRRGGTVSLRLASGDVVVMGDESRHCFHGIDRIVQGSSSLVPDGGRLNLTLRRVTPLLRGPILPS